MADHIIKMPDIGEGIAEAELLEWLVAVGDEVAMDAPLAEVTTDKARVQIPSPVAGRVLHLGASPGDLVAVGSELIRLGVGGKGPEPATPVPQDDDRPPMTLTRQAGQSRTAPSPSPSNHPEGVKVLAAPAVRARAREAGIDLATVSGTGPDKRVTMADLEAISVRSTAPVDGDTHATSGAGEGITEIPMTGIRRLTARRLQASWRAIPHITIVEEVDVTELEALRAHLNTSDRTPLTVLPFLVRALVRAVGEHPELNAHLDDATDTIRQFEAVHVGIATQAPDGLKVPVLRHAERLDLWETTAGIGTVTAAARDGRATRAELTGSTITITSLGKLGAIATTPIINAPEVAIVGVNRQAVRPVWNGSAFVPRTMMNLSCSFDHRVIDGLAAATFVARLKELLETPALPYVLPR